MNITEAHNQLNEWYPGCSHHIGIDFWQWGHMDNKIEIKYSVSVHRPYSAGDSTVVHVSGEPSLENAILRVAPKPEISESATLNAANEAQKEVESLAK